MAKPNRRNVRQIGRERIDIFAHLKFNPNTMASKDPRVDTYIAKSADFAKPILTHIRETVHAACPEVEESMKWSMPAFSYHGPLMNMAAFKAHATVGFWKGALVVGRSA